MPQHRYSARQTHHSGHHRQSLAATSGYCRLHSYRWYAPAHYVRCPDVLPTRQVLHPAQEYTPLSAIHSFPDSVASAAGKAVTGCASGNLLRSSCSMFPFLFMRRLTAAAKHSTIFLYRHNFPWMILPTFPAVSIVLIAAGGADINFIPIQVINGID